MMRHPNCFPMSRHSRHETIGHFLKTLSVSLEVLGEGEGFERGKRSSREVRSGMKGFAERILSVLNEVSGQAQELAESYPMKADLSGQEKEAFITSLLNRFLRVHDEAFPDIPRPIPTMEGLLNRANEIEWRMFESIFFRLPFPIYRDIKGPEGVIPGNGEGIEPTRDGHKIIVFRKILGDLGIDWSNLEGVKEELDRNQFRKYPYHLIYIPSLSRTVAISNEVGEETYVYKGIIPPDSFHMAMKGKPIGESPCKGIFFDSQYEENFIEALTMDWKVEEKIVPSEEDEQRLAGVFSPELITECGLEDLLTWHLELVAATAELQEAGIICEKGIWYFEDAGGVESWPKIGSRRLRSFPGQTYNRMHKLGDDEGLLLNPGQLREMFACLGLRVATEEEEKSRWGDMLVSSISALTEAGIMYKNGIWYFGDAKGDKHWPQVGGKILQCFPSSTFNKKRRLGGGKGKLTNPNQLREMFAYLGLQVATDKEEKTRWAEILIAAIPELQKADIICENGIWYFEDAKGMKQWPRVGGKTLSCFPSTTVNQEHNLGDKRGHLKSRTQLRAMFAYLGFRVATEDEEKIRWANMLITAARELGEVGIIYENGIWYFGDAKGMDNWPRIGGRILKCFPSSTFNQQHNLENETGRLSNPIHLRDMFACLGLRVATEEEERARKLIS